MRRCRGASLASLVLFMLGAETLCNEQHKGLPVVHFWPPNPFQRHRRYLDTEPRVSPRVMRVDGGRRSAKFRDLFEMEEGYEMGEGGILYGGIAFRPSNISIDADFAANTDEVRHVIRQALKLAGMDASEDEIRLQSFSRLPLLITNDHGMSTMRLRVKFIGASGSPKATEAVAAMNHGVNYYFRLSIGNFCHSFGISLDEDGRYNLYQHTFAPSHVSVEVEVDAAAELSESAAAPSVIKVLSYNVWNTNPPHWVYNNNVKRKERYNRRMDLLAQNIKDSGADIVALQEVRYDSSFSSRNFQLEHILERLGESWQHVYQPAMDYFEAEKGQKGREEEGLAIISRFPIIKTDYLLLPRLFNDGDDKQHQRACLHAQVLANEKAIDVFVTHLSLSQRARELCRSSLGVYPQQPSTSGVSLFMGDLNSESQDPFFTLLKGKLKDAWLELYDEPEPRSADENVQRHALTFPSDNPTKRIDFVLYQDGEAAEKQTRVLSCKLIGQDPTPETENDAGNGMLDPDSRLYASDHRGVLVEFELFNEII